LVNIWATWCVPCRAEMPAMQRLYREFGPAGFKIAAVSIDEGGPAVVSEFAKEFGITFDVLHDASGKIQEAYQTTGFPESFLLDKNGNIVKKVIGEHPWSSPASRRIVANLLGIPIPPTDSASPTGPPQPAKPAAGG
jgi:cytochrome c biogenesis protein CcmG, thiol:disulfide interchange protein DsbE